jgi:hypothetical protein
MCYDNREEFLRERDLFFSKVLSPQKNKWVMESSTLHINFPFTNYGKED